MEEPVPVMGGGKWKMLRSSKSRSKSMAIDAQIHHINVMNLHSSSSSQIGNNNNHDIGSSNEPNESRGR
jgi:hypothetical protein